MLANYKINQPFTSDCSVGKERKIPVALEIMEPAELSTMLKPGFFFTQKPEKSVEGKPYSRNTVKANSFRTEQNFFLVPFKESRFPLFYPASRVSFDLPRKIEGDSARRVPLFGISIQAGSSRSITERSCATGKLKTTTSRLKYFISSERATKNQSTFKRYRFYTFCVSQM